MERLTQVGPWHRPAPSAKRSVAFIVSLCITVAVIAALHLAQAVNPPDHSPSDRTPATHSPAATHASR
jgi:hypothetical protein